MSYLERRQNPLSNCPVEEVEEAFEIIANKFGKDWLNNQSGVNPLQKLWMRRDALSTNELFTFGKSLISAQIASGDWLKNQIKLVKGKDENNRKGAIFEILAVGYTSTHQRVIPATANQPGYDIDVETKNGTLYRASLKRYSQSAHEKLFLKKSATAEKRALEGLKLSKKNTTFYIQSKEYPSESDWQKIYSEIYRLTAEFKGVKEVVAIDETWLVGLLPLHSPEESPFSKSHISYSFLCVSPYHKNERDNFLSKLESAVSNLERHVNRKSGQLPVIIMQLPATASSSALTLWAQEYLEANRSSALEAVFFCNHTLQATKTAPLALLHFILPPQYLHHFDNFPTRS